MLLTDERDGASLRLIAPFRLRRILLAFAIIVVLSVLFTPLAADHHYQILILPAAVLVATVEWKKLNALTTIGYGLLVYCLFGWLPGLPEIYTQSWGSFLAYPRVAGTVVLCYLLMKSLGYSPPIPTTSADVQ